MSGTSGTIFEEMKIADRIMGNVSEEEVLDEASYDNKSAYKAAKEALASVQKAGLTMKDMAKSKWGKANSSDARALNDLVKQTDKVAAKLRGIAAGLGVQAGV